MGNISKLAGSRNYADFPAASAAQAGEVYRARDLGTNAHSSVFICDGTDWYPFGGCCTLYLGDAAATTLAGNGGGAIQDLTHSTIALPANLLGNKGQLELRLLFSHTGTNTKYIVVGLGGADAVTVTLTTQLSTQILIVIAADGSATAQIMQASSGTGGLGAVAASAVTKTVNLGAASTLTIGSRLSAAASTAGAGETSVLQSASVKLLK